MSVRFLAPKIETTPNGQKLVSKLIFVMGGINTEKNISFSVPENFRQHNDCTAAALSSLVGKKYGAIHYDFPVSPRCRNYISDTYGIEVGSSGALDIQRNSGKHVILSFSGGFDSLSAYLLAPGHFKSLAIDFGGPFERENAFFSTFPDITVCSTDLRSTGFAQNDWRFMGAPAMLFAEHLDAYAIAFGSILEATEWNFRKDLAYKKPKEEGPFGAAGLVELSPVRGLTEFGTAMVIMHRCPHKLEDSLKSLAAAHSEKAFRKRIIVDCAREYLTGNKSADLGSYNPPTERISIGESFTVDFLAYYFVARFGKEAASKWIDNVEKIELEGIGVDDMAFYFKYNTNFLSQIPESFRNVVLSGFHSCGIHPYNEIDWENIRSVQKRMSNRWSFP